MWSVVRENGINALEFARRVTLALLEGIPEDQRLHRAVPTGGHALWIAGHVTVTDDFFLATLSGADKTLPGRWHEIFAMGSAVSSDATDYPKWDEVLEKLAATRTDLLTYFRTIDDEKLSEQLPEPIRGFGANQAALMSSIAWHEGVHAGQLTVIRRSLGIAPKFG